MELAAFMIGAAISCFIVPTIWSSKWYDKKLEQAREAGERFWN